MMKFKKVLLLLSCFAFLGILSCSKDDNVVNNIIPIFTPKVEASISGSINCAFVTSDVKSTRIYGVRQVIATMNDTLTGGQKIIEMNFPNSVLPGDEFVISLNTTISVSNKETNNSSLESYAIKIGKINITSVTDTTFSGTFDGISNDITISNAKFSAKK